MGRLEKKTMINGTVLIYSYDSQDLYTPDGQPYSLRYLADSTAEQKEWAAYYYIVNQQGDVIALTNATGSIVAKYSYDAWGKVTSVRDASNNIISSSTHIGNINPIRYRGYYYDVESSLYYLQSRYYDPEVGRFINADAAEYATTSTVQLNDTNLFAYCGNDPINNIDSDGELFNTIVGGLIGGITGAISAAITGDDVVAGALSGAVNGVISGFGADVAVATIAAGPAGIAVAVVASFATGAVGVVASEATNSLITGKKFDEDGDLFLTAITAGVTNTIASSVGACLSGAVSRTPQNTSLKISNIYTSMKKSVTHVTAIEAAISTDYTVKTTLISGLTTRIVKSFLE